MQFAKRALFASLLFTGLLGLPWMLARFSRDLPRDSEIYRSPAASAPLCSSVFTDPGSGGGGGADPLAGIRRAAIGGLFHRPSLHPLDIQWYVRADENKHIWMTGASHVARGVTDIYVRTPERISENESFVLLLENFRKNGLDVIHPSKAGLAITLDSAPMKPETYQVISVNSLKDPLTRKETLEAQENLPEDFLNFVFEGYRKRMDIDEATIDRLRQVSQDVADRTLLFVKTKEAYTQMKQDSGEVIFMQDRRKLPANPIEAARVMGRLMPEHFTLEAGAAVVLSRRPGEKLPLELFTGFDIPRTGDGILAEVGRFYVDKAGPDEAMTSTRLMGLFATMLQRQDVSAMVIEADAARARLFGRLGFKSIHQRKNFAGRTEHIMTAKPSEVADSVMKMLMEQLTPDSHLPRTLSAPQQIPIMIDPKRYLSPDDPRSNPTSFGGLYDISAVLSQVSDLMATRYSAAEKRKAVDLLLRNATELRALSSEQIKGLTSYIMKKPATLSFKEGLIAWLKSAGRTDLLYAIYPHLKVEEFCNSRLKEVRDGLWAAKTPKPEALALMSQAIQEQPDIVRAMQGGYLERFAQKLLDPAYKSLLPYDVSLEVLREKTYSGYGTPR